MSGVRVSWLAAELGYRTLRVEVARRDDGAPVWRGTVRSLRQVMWCCEAVDIGELLETLARWLETDVHRGDCRCAYCLEAEAHAAELVALDE